MCYSIIFVMYNIIRQFEKVWGASASLWYSIWAVIYGGFGESTPGLFIIGMH